MIKQTKEIISNAQTKISCIDIKTAIKLYNEAENPIVIDVREVSSAETCKLNDSINIPRGLLEMKVHGHCPTHDQLILIHCAAGGRASLAALTLKEMGYTNVHAITAKYEEIKKAFG